MFQFHIPHQEGAARAPIIHTLKTQVGSSSRPTAPIGTYSTISLSSCHFHQAPCLVSSCCRGCIPLATLVALVNWQHEGTQHNSGMVLETSASHCGMLVECNEIFNYVLYRWRCLGCLKTNIWQNLQIISEQHWLHFLSMPRWELGPLGPPRIVFPDSLRT